MAEASHLPFRDSAFDGVFARGVVLSYVPLASLLLREARRVLRAGGRLALDAMNRIEARPSFIGRGFHMWGGRPSYVELAVRSGRQVRWVYHLAKGSPYARRAAKDDPCESRPRNLSRYVEDKVRYEARLFREGELRDLVRRAGFRDVEVTPLGHLAYAQRSKDEEVAGFLAANAHVLSKLYLSLGKHMRPETALHLFVTAKRP